MLRRDVLRILAALPFVSVSFISPWMYGVKNAQGAGNILDKKYDRYVDHIPAIPIILFHRIEDTPRFPEDMGTEPLAALFRYIWRAGYSPVNMTDIITGQIDTVVAKGRMPLGVTADGAHASLIFSQNTAPQGGDKGMLNNARSFVEIIASSMPQNVLPRATFFLSVGPKPPNKESTYFGSIMPLKDIADALTVMPGIEFGYQTRWYTPVHSINEKQMTTLIEDQMEDLQKLDMFDRVSRIMAYPFGGRPNEEGMLALRNAKFLGGVLTYPGVGEAHYTQIPQCIYDGKLMTDPFLIPRVAIGSHVYAKGTKPVKNPPIDPIDDFHKDVEEAIPSIYISRGIK